VETGLRVFQPRQSKQARKRAKVKVIMSSVYFGGSRNLPQSKLVPQVVQAVISSGSSVHVGCQFGADEQVALFAAFRHCLSLVVFAVSPVLAQAPAHVQRCARAGAQVVLAAGGSAQVPVKARYLLRSKAAFAGCSAAVFFAPGSGSLAVAREAVKSGIPVFAFWVQAYPPASIPSTPGQWVRSSFAGFGCWQFQPGQSGLF
jgi:hypothetical protein